MGIQNNRAQIANRRLVLPRVQSDLGTQVGAMNDSRMVLGAPHVAGVFKSDPRMPCFKQHRQHPLPDFNCRNFLTPNLTLRCPLLIFHVRLFKLFPIQMMQIGCVTGSEERPILSCLHPLHE